MLQVLYRLFIDMFTISSNECFSYYDNSKYFNCTLTYILKLKLPRVLDGFYSRNIKKPLYLSVRN